MDTQRRQNHRPVRLLVRLLEFKPDGLRPGHARLVRGAWKNTGRAKERVEKQRLSHR
jgi:hypothetical protein